MKSDRLKICYRMFVRYDEANDNWIYVTKDAVSSVQRKLWMLQVFQIPASTSQLPLLACS